jgi:6-pyruvoyltetrahydropterin/6-carboxytetrahydropterin synthase
MYEVMVRLNFSAAHRVEDYPGNCERLHGHNWAVEVFAEKRKLDSLGMVVDFRKLKDAAKETLSKLDHSYLNELEEFRKVNPTAENIARLIFDEISLKIPLSKVNVFESENTMATYFREKA